MKAITTLQKNVATAGTAVQVSTTPLLVKNLRIKAKGANTGYIHIGAHGSTFNTSGHQLGPGEEFAWPGSDVDAVDLSQVDINATVNGEGVTIFGWG